MNFKPAQLESFCKNPDPAVKCIVLYGNNEGEISMLQKRCAEAVCGSVDDAFRYCQLRMEDISKDGGEVYAEFHAQSLMGGRRAVVVQNADNNLAALLKNMLPDTNSENLLILCSSTFRKNSSLLTWGKERKDILLVACYEDRDSDIAADAEAMLRSKGILIDRPTLQVLSARLSPDKRLNQSEIDKLAVYLGERKTVSVDDIKNAVSDAAGASIEDLCYFTAGGNALRACAMYNRLVKEGEEPASLIRQTEYHFVRLLEAATQVADGNSETAVVEALNLIFYRKDDFKRQLRIWKKEQILSALNMLYECERDCKTTGMPDEQIAGYTILRLAKFAAKNH